MTALPKKLRSQVRHLTPKRLAGIGRVAAELTEFEGSVEQMIWRLAGLENEVLAGCITSHMNLSEKLDALLELTREAQPKSQLMKLLIEVDKTLRPGTAWQRHLVGPGIWSLGGALGQATKDSKPPTRKIVKRSRKKYSSEVGTVAPDGLDDIADRIASATYRLRIVFAAMRQREALPKVKARQKKKRKPGRRKKG
jgi:hypothetical protein